MTPSDITHIEDFVRWANERGLRPGVTFHRAPIAKLKKTGKYEVEFNTIERSCHNYYTATPKDERLEGLTYFD